jgi:hypothetical protein
MGMGKGDFLGELEQLVLLTVLRLGDDAYGMNIRRELSARSGRDVAIGAVYSALDRMEEKGFLTSWTSAAVAPAAASRLSRPARQRFAIRCEQSTVWSTD